MKNIGHYAALPENNFNLMRLVGALFIVFAHSYNIRTGVEYDSSAAVEKIYFFGFRALDMFFVFSGFFVTASVLHSKTTTDFITARILRIFPALVVVNIVCALLIGPLNTKLSLTEYFSSFEVLEFWFVTSVTGSPHTTLPGVFTEIPGPEGLNQPLWTLRYELIFYVGLALACAVGMLRKKSLWLASIGTFALLLVLDNLYWNFASAKASFVHVSHFALCFGLGSLFWLYKQNIPLHWSLVAIICASSWALQGTAVADIMLILSAGYTCMWLGFLPAGPLAGYHKAGDYSYGTYIMHWPIAATIFVQFPYWSPELCMVATLLITLPLAVMSWHYVEKPVMASRRLVSAKIQGLFGQTANRVSKLASSKS